MKRYEGVNISKLYEDKFGIPAPYYDFAAEYRTMEDWEEIMIKAIEKGKPHKIEYSNDPNILY